MEQSNKEIIKGIKLIHRALIIGVLFFLAVSIYLNMEIGALMEDDSLNLTFFIVFNLISVIAIFAGIKVFGKRMKIVQNASLPVKLEKYRESFIIRAASIEGPAFFFITGYLLTGASEFAFEAVACLLILFIFYPTNKRLSDELNHDIRNLD